jgi:hypothetical protein
MTIQDANGIQIDHTHSGAICNEVAERLRAVLPEKPGRLPPDLLRLTRQLDSVESGEAAFESQIAIGPR